METEKIYSKGAKKVSEDCSLNELEELALNF